jgi:flagellar biogenesis protein FliO
MKRHALIAAGWMILTGTSWGQGVTAGVDAVVPEPAVAPAAKEASRLGRPTGGDEDGAGAVSALGWRRNEAETGRPPWMLRYLGSLIIVGVLLIGGFAVLRRFQGRLRLSGAGGIDMRVLARIPLDQRNSLVLIRLRDEEVLLAIGTGGTNLVARFPAAHSESAA